MLHRDFGLPSSHSLHIHVQPSAAEKWLHDQLTSAEWQALTGFVVDHADDRTCQNDLPCTVAWAALHMVKQGGCSRRD